MPRWHHNAWRFLALNLAGHWSFAFAFELQASELIQHAKPPPIQPDAPSPTSALGSCRLAHGFISPSDRIALVVSETRNDI